MPRFAVKPGSYAKAKRKQGGRSRQKVSKAAATAVLNAMTRTPMLEIGTKRGQSVHNIVTYRDIYNLATGALGATPGQIVFNLNSIYSPQQNAGGHQPLYHDQLVALYAYYSVKACTVTAEVCWSQTNTTATDPQAVMLVASRDVPAATKAVFNNLAEDRAALKVGPFVVLNTANVRRLRRRFIMSEVLGMSHADVELGNWNVSVVGSNPATLLYGTLTNDLIGTSGVGGLAVTVTLDYEVEWSGPIRPTQS